jgi:hypothetical protein
MPRNLRNCMLAVSVVLGSSGASVAQAIVETQQSVAYELPAGWSVSVWTEATGEAVLKNKKTGDVMWVERQGVATAQKGYTNSEQVLPDRTLAWQYIPADTRAGVVLPDSLRGELRFPDAVIHMQVAAENKGLLSNAAVDQTGGLDALRRVASSLRVLGARRCWPPGDCPPGEVKQAN